MIIDDLVKLLLKEIAETYNPTFLKEKAHFHKLAATIIKYNIKKEKQKTFFNYYLNLQNRKI